MPARGRHLPRGLSLLETVIGGFLLAMVGFALLNLFPTSILSLRKGHDLVNASNLAQQAIEQLRVQSLASLANGPQKPSDVVVEGTPYHVAPTVAARDADTRDVAVTVSWSVAQHDAASSNPASITFNTTLYAFHNP